MKLSPEHENLIPIPVEEFMSGQKVPVDVHLRLSSFKYVLLFKEGESVELDRLKKYRDKQVEYLYVDRDRYAEMVTKNLVIADVILSKKELASSKKAQFLTSAAISVVRELKEQGVNEESYVHARMISHSTQVLVESKPSLLNVMSALAAASDQLLAHSLAVSLFSVMIGKELKWHSSVTLEKLALGGLLHDIGKKEIDDDIVSKPRCDMTKEELQEYETHPYRGMEILKTVPAVPDDVIAIVYEHHENFTGQGFPRHLHKFYINPLAQVVSLANAFCNLVLETPNYPGKKTPMEALQFIETIERGTYNSDALEALKSIIANQKSKFAS